MVTILSPFNTPDNLFVEFPKVEQLLHKRPAAVTMLPILGQVRSDEVVALHELKLL